MMAVVSSHTTHSPEELLGKLQKESLSPATGQWELELGGGDRTTISIAKGQIVKVGSQVLDWKCIVGCLTRYTKLRNESLLGAVNQQSDLSLKLRELVVAGMTPQEIRTSVRLGLVTQLERLFSRRGGRAYFRDYFALVEPPKMIAFSLAELISEVEGRRREWLKIQPLIPDLDRVPTLRADAGPDSIPSAWSTWLSKGYTIEQIACRSRRDSLLVARNIALLITQKKVELDASAPSRSQPKSQPTIVCVDDSLAVGKEISKLLASIGAKVISITEPLKAMAEIPSIKPDIILMDLNMPGINGKRLCKMLRRHPDLVNTPIILATAYPNIGLDMDDTDVLRKPFQQYEVQQKVLQYLR